MLFSYQSFIEKDLSGLDGKIKAKIKKSIGKKL
jgi:hypothetical protein